MQRVEVLLLGAQHVVQGARQHLHFVIAVVLAHVRQRGRIGRRGQPRFDGAAERIQRPRQAARRTAAQRHHAPRMAPSSRIWCSSARAPDRPATSGWRTRMVQVSVAGSPGVPVRA
jgi:hypothetical protein